MPITIKWSARMPAVRSNQISLFFQRMANRITVGEWRYDAPNARKRYLSRMKAELDKYEETGNTEHLINIANYAFLESVCPEHPQAHFNNKVGSATRHRFGGERREGD